MRKSYMEVFNKHDVDDVCSECHGYFENFVYNYDEMYKRYNGHLRHFYVYDYYRNNKKDMTEYNNLIRHCQNIGFFGPMAQCHLWKIDRDIKTGYLRFEKWRG